MIKIIGQDPQTAKRITCPHCGAINEYHPIDVRVLYSGKDYSGGADGAKGFDCGQCSKPIKTETW